MKTTITPTERLRVAELIHEGQRHHASLNEIELVIAMTLGFGIDADRDAITDAIGAPQTVDDLLLRLNILVEDQA